MIDLEIRRQIAALVEGQTKVGDLEDWLEGEAWEAGDESLATQHLAHDALRLLAEHDNGDWTETELAEKLGILSRTYWFEQATKVAFPGSDASVIWRSQRSAATDRSRAAADA